MRLGRLTNELHAGFVRSAATLLVIASKTCRDDVVPSLLSTGRNGDHMIERQIFRRKFLAAILARIVVACVNVRARKLDAIVVFHADILQQSNDGGELQREGDGMD